jgi:crotonobetainyl-CoA:carnitine CoA-transferase CaiB-like acyl-CoA transferase
MAGPLDGLLVLDFTNLLPGPLTTLMLRRAGARVVKIERPGGDELRAYEPKLGADSVQFALLNEGKEVLTLDLKSGDRDRLEPLLRSCDVLVEQFRPGVMDRLGLGYQAVRDVNPGVVYCSITGYGASGPLAATAGHDLNYMAAAGLLSLTREPSLPPVLVADIGGAAFPAVVQVLLALLGRQRTGEGSRVEVSMARSLFTWVPYQLGSGFLTGRWPEPGDGLTTGGSPRYNLYRAADGRFLAVAAIEDRFWKRLCELLEVDEDSDADTLARVIGSRPSEEWRALLEGEDTCANVVRTLEEAVADPQFRDLFDCLLPGQRIPALPLPLPGFDR